MPRISIPAVYVYLCGGGGGNEEKHRRKQKENKRKGEVTFGDQQSLCLKFAVSWMSQVKG